MERVNSTQMNGLWSLVETIEWSEPLFMALLVFHLLVLSITFLTMKRYSLQAIHFFVLLLVVFFAEQLNEIAAVYSRHLASQQYFDSKGMFISFFLSGPLLLNCLIVVMSWIVYSSQMMVTTGKMKLERRLERERQLKEKREADKKK